MTTRLSLLLPLSSPFILPRELFFFGLDVSLIFSLPFFVFFFSFRLSKKRQRQQQQKQPKTVVVTFSLSGKIVQNCSTKQQQERDDFQLGRVDGLLPVRVFVSGTHRHTQTQTRFLYIFISLARTLPLSLALTRNFPSRHGTNDFLRRNNTNT